jgi:hypothetical protein
MAISVLEARLLIKGVKILSAEFSNFVLRGRRNGFLLAFQLLMTFWPIQSYRQKKF